MNKKPLISAVINVHNESKNLNKCLKSLKNFADEIIVVDMNSTDDSKQIAIKYGATIYDYHWLKYVEPARNFAISKANGTWIMLLDPDEHLDQSLKNELKLITERKDVCWVKIARKNIIFGKWMRHCRYWPDYLIRFFKRGFVTWNKQIHSQPSTKGPGLTLLDSPKLAIKHNAYPTITQFLTRSIRYSNIQADELKNSGYKVKISDFILKPTQEFNSRFFSGEGYKDGLHGLIFCLLQSFAIAQIYIRLWEKQKYPSKILSKESFVSANQESIFEYSYWFSKYLREEYTRNIFKLFFIRLRHLLNRITKNF